MRILVTGGAGFIGSHLVERLLAASHEVTIVDDFNDFYDPAVKRANLAAVADHPDLSVLEGDIRDARLVNLAMVRARPEAVVHLAARAGVRPSLLEPELYLDVNVRGTWMVLDAAQRVGADQFVFASSSSVYGNESRAPFVEEQPADRPASPYGATKRMGEILAHTFHHLHGLNVTCLRLFTVYGARCRPDLAVNKFSRLILKGEPVPVYGNGSAQRDFTYIDDIVDGVVRALERPRGYNLINLGCGQPITVLQLVSLLEERLGGTADVQFLPPQAGDVEMTYAGVDRARELLQWSPLTGIERGLDLWCEWLFAQASVGVNP